MTLARPALLVAAALLASAQAAAQVPAPPPIPPPSAPAPNAVTPPPPPPPDYTSDPDLEPQVTIIRRDEEVVEEVRVRGELQYVRVTPRHGKSYFLVPDPNGNAFIRRDSLDIKLKVPMWQLFSW